MSSVDEREARELEALKEGRSRAPQARRGVSGRAHFAPGADVPKAADFKGSMRRALGYLSAHKGKLALVIAAAVLSTAFGVVGPAILGRATSVLFDGANALIMGTGGIDFDAIARILIVVLVIYVASSAMSFLQGFVMAGITQRICYELRRDLERKLEHLPMRYFESSSKGDLLSRVTNDVDTMGNGLSQVTTQLITSVVTLVGVLAMMLMISPVMTLVALVTLLLTVGVAMGVMKVGQPFFRAQQANLGRLDGLVEETMSGHAVVRAYCREDAVKEDFAQVNAALTETSWKSQFLSGLMMPATQFIGNLGYVAVAVLGAVLVARGAIRVGDIQAFIQYIRNFNQPLTQLAQVGTLMQSMAAAAERVFQVLDEPDEDPVPGTRGQGGDGAGPASGASSPDPADAEGLVEFDHVRFGYDPGKPVINDFTCRVEPGQTLAIVGETGAGKTTIVKLLMRFYDVDAGAIRLDGVDTREYDRHDLRRAFGMVLQDTWLFKGSIRDNIRYGRLDATDAEVEHAATVALADPFIRALPDGYDTELNEDASNISAGQRQLLTIARALLADAPLLILDEATSNVDTRTEERIQQAMDALMRGRTCFVIAHRLSTIRDADRILVMRAGDVVETGTHQELLDAHGVYTALYLNQFATIDEASHA